jgi:hypothetical protein
MTSSEQPAGATPLASDASSPAAATSGKPAPSTDCTASHLCEERGERAEWAAGESESERERERERERSGLRGRARERGEG